MDLADPQYKGKLELAPGETDFWPIVTLDRACQGQDGGPELAEGAQVQRRLRRSHPRQRDARRRRQQGRRRHGPDQPLLLLPAARRDGRGQLPREAVAYSPPRDPGYVEDISGAGDPEVLQEPGGRPEVPGVHDQPGGAADAGHSASFEYPLAKGVAPNPALPPFDKYEPNPITPAQIGTGTDAQDLLQQARADLTADGARYMTTRGRHRGRGRLRRRSGRGWPRGGRERADRGGAAGSAGAGGARRAQHRVGRDPPRCCSASAR